MKPKRLSGSSSGTDDHEVAVAGDVGQRERHQRMLVGLGVVGEVIDDLHLLGRNAEVLGIHRHVVVGDEHQPAGPELRHRVVGEGRRAPASSSADDEQRLSYRDLRLDVGMRIVAGQHEVLELEIEDRGAGPD